MSLTLVLGGARSGKSAYAQKAAEAAAGGARPLMIVTAKAGDGEMAERIARHRADRGDRWTTVEAPLALSEVLATLTPSDVAVVDCLTLWLSNLMMHGRDTAPAVAELIEAFARCAARTWVISNEVGLGIVPDNALARRYRDDIGQIHQKIASIAAHVVLMVAGLPLTIK